MVLAVKPEATAGLVDMTLTREGYLVYFYADAKGLISIGKGFLAESGGAPAIPASLVFNCVPAAVRASWLAVKAEYMREQARFARGETTKTARINGGAHYIEVPGNIARATRESVEATFLAHVAVDEAHLRTVFPEWDEWPWQAQLSTSSIAYAAGRYVEVDWPRFTAACRANDWGTAALECKPSPAEMAKQNDSFQRRIVEQVRLFREAAQLRDTVPEVIVAADNQPVYAAPEPPERDPEAA